MDFNKPYRSVKTRRFVTISCFPRQSGQKNIYSVFDFFLITKVSLKFSLDILQYLKKYILQLINNVVNIFFVVGHSGLENKR